MVLFANYGFLYCAAEEQGVTPDKLAGTIQNDILKEYMVRNTYIYPPEMSMKIIADIFEYTSQIYAEVQLAFQFLDIICKKRERPRILSLAYTLADGLEYVRTGLKSRDRYRFICTTIIVLLGNRDELLHGSSENASSSSNVGTDDCNLLTQKIQNHWRLRTHSQTSGWSLTEQDPFNNVTRTLIEANAAAMGHTQSLHTNALDEAIALPTDFSARIARNTQLFPYKKKQG